MDSEKTTENESGVFVYDYRTISIRRETEAMAADAYTALGWEIVGSSVFGFSIFGSELSLKRPRKIENKQKLLEIQKQVDELLEKIDKLHIKQKGLSILPAEWFFRTLKMKRIENYAAKIEAECNKIADLCEQAQQLVKQTKKIQGE